MPGRKTYRAKAIVLDRTRGTAGASVAMMGTAYVFADATQSPIRPGDMLTTSSRPGHAMAVREVDRAFGAVIGKALTSLDGATGLVKVFLTAR